MPVSRMDVFRAYQIVLGRAPESEMAVQAHMLHRDVWALFSVLASSPERANTKLISKDTFPFIPLNHPSNLVDSDGSPNELDVLWDKVRATWEGLGATRPHHSVITQPEFLPRAFRDNEDAFWRSGEREAEQTIGMLSRYGYRNIDSKVACELGCGVGRLSVPLSRSFAQLIAYDISQPHLDVAHDRAQEQQRQNVSFVCLSKRVAFEIASCDFFYTRIVLQHNPPPVMKSMIAQSLQALRPGGIGLFQLPTYQVGYSFVLKEYLRKPSSSDMEMHALPQEIVLRTIRDADCELIEVREDNEPGRPDLFLSNTFAVRKVTPR